MKKRYLVLFLCIPVLICCFASCGKSEDKQAKTEKESVTEKNVDPLLYYGCWKYTDSLEWICIFEDGNFMIHSGMEEIIPPTEYEVTPQGIYLPKMEIILSFNEEGTLVSSDGFSFEKSELAAYDLYIEYNIS